jgi:hypothetical protein
LIIGNALALGLTAFSKGVRNTLMKDLYYDFDLKNAQPEIIRNICEANNIKCDKVKEYCKNRPKILQEITDTYDVDVKNAKKLMLRLCFFGTFKGFCDDNNLLRVSASQFILEFQKELQEIAEETRKVNPKLYETARQTFYALYLQEYEYRIVESVMSHLYQKTEVLNHPLNEKSKICVYEYDGLKLLKENVDKFGKEKLTQLLNDITYDLTGFRLVWKEKAIEDTFDISELLIEKEKQIE